MREATQRSVMRCAFIIGCVAPTLAVVAWSIAWALPSHGSALETRVQDILGAKLSIGTVQHPRPSEFDLRDLQLLDPETNDRLGQINQVYVSWHSDELRLEIDCLELEPHRRSRLWHLLRTHLESQASNSWDKVIVHARRVSTTSNANETIHNIAGRIRSNPEKLEGQFTFTLPEPGHENPVFEVTVLRDRQKDPLETRILVNSDNQPLPLNLVSPRWVERLGSNALLRGNLLTTWRSDDWKVRFVGNLEAIHFDSASFTGNAQLQQLDATLTRDGVAELSGVFQIKAGAIRVQVLNQLGVKTGSLAKSDLINIENLSVDFRSNNTSIELHGNCDSSKADPSAPAAFLISSDGQEFHLERPTYWLAHIQGILAPQSLKRND